MGEIIGRPAEIITITQNASIREAADRMHTNKVGCLVVLDKHGALMGLVTERDISNKVAYSTNDLDKAIVAEIMAKHVVSCSPGTPTGKAREIMTANRIRHLPIVEDGVVVGILSARDLMGRQLQEDRAAAEEVAMLSNCLKSIDLNEVANIVTTEVPKLFQAKNCVLCFHKDDSQEDEPDLVSYNRCLCPKGQLKRLKDIDGLLKQGEFCCDNIPYGCKELGAEPPRLILPLKLHSFKDSCLNTSKSLSGYLCLCGLAPAIAANRELISYKAKLAREILNSHLTNAKLYQEARLTSLTDALTSVGSRKLLESKLEAEFARSKRYKRPFSVAIIDLDNFKTINDTLGHASGDIALKKLAECMNNQKRTPDILARYGGDEFVILLPETKEQQAFTLLERLRAKVHDIKLDKGLSMTISCGIAQSLPDADDSSSEVMRRADMALYEAKSAGRDCTKVWNKNMTKRLDTNDIEIEKINNLQRRIAGMSEQAEKMFMQSIWALVQALEAKDVFAEKHSENVMRYAVGIAQMMEIGPKQIEVIRRAAMIHDIGKIGVPDAILAKPDRLMPDERNLVEQHPVIAARILSKMSFLEREMAMVRHHHEKWNGQGYPDGLSRSSIPLGARILAVADTFDALTAERAYNESRSVATAMKILIDSAGYDLDPEIVAAMFNWVEAIGKKLGKTTEQLTLADLSDSRIQPPESDPPVASAAATAASIK